MDLDHKSFIPPDYKIINFAQLNAFNYQLVQTKEPNQRMINIQVLINSPNEIITKYMNSNQSKLITKYLHDALANVDSKMIDKIFDFLRRVNLTPEMLKMSGLMLYLQQTFKDSNKLPENMSSLFLNFYYKFQNLIQSPQERLNNANNFNIGPNGPYLSYPLPTQHYSKYNKSRSKSIERSRSRSRSYKKRKEQKKRDKERKKIVRWKNDQQLALLRIFKRDDEPNAKPMNQMEVQDYQRKYIEESVSKRVNLNRKLLLHGDDMTHEDLISEGMQIKRLHMDVHTIGEQMKFCRPIRIKNWKMESHGYESLSKDIQNQRVLFKLFEYYNKESEIPIEPVDSQFSQTSQRICNTIPLQKPNQDDLLNIVQILVSSPALKPQKKIKGILKNSNQTESNRKLDLSDQIGLLGRTLEEMKNTNVIEDIVPIIKDIITTMREEGKEKYLPNLVTIIKKGFSQGILSTSMMQSTNQQPSAHDQLQQRGIMKNYKTKPCHNFHSFRGCIRGNDCNFIHDQNFQGRLVPFHTLSNPQGIQPSYLPMQASIIQPSGPQQGYPINNYPPYNSQPIPSMPSQNGMGNHNHNHMIGINQHPSQNHGIGYMSMPPSYHMPNHNQGGMGMIPHSGVFYQVKHFHQNSQVL